MLAADKQLLDAQLRNELQQLRRLEITNVRAVASLLSILSEQQLALSRRWSTASRTR